MSFLFDSQPLVVNKDLATAIGLNEALVLQQIHYWLEINRQADKNSYDGCYWTYNTVAEWQEQFPFFSYDTVKRTLRKLRDAGLLLTGNYNRKKMDRTIWYTIDYSRLEEIEREYRSSGTPETPESETGGTPTNNVKNTHVKCDDIHTNPGSQTEKSSENRAEPHWGKMHQCNSANCPNGLGQNAPLQKGNLPQAIPEITTEINSEISSSSSAEKDPLPAPGIKAMRKRIEKNIGYVDLRQKYDPKSVEELLRLIVNTVCSRVPSLRFGQQDVPMQEIRARLLELNGEHMVLVLKALQKVDRKSIRNYPAYILKSLYNAPMMQLMAGTKSVEASGFGISYDLKKVEERGKKMPAYRKTKF